MWDKEYLRKLRSYYKKRFKSACDPEEKVDLLNTICSIDEIIDFVDDDGSKQELQTESFKDICHNESSFFSYFKKLVPYVSNFTNSYASDIFFSFGALYQFENNNKKDVLGFTKELYNSLDERFAKPFNRVFNKNKQWIRYEERIGDSYTFPIINTNIILMILSHCNSIEDYFSMTHEYGHGIDITYSMKELLNVDRVPFLEVVSMFMEMVCSNFLEEKGYNARDILVYDISSFTKILELSIIANEKNNIVKMFEQAKIFSRKQAAKYLKNEVLMEESGIQQVLHSSITEQFPYAISYLIAIELYLIYLQDKEEAFNILYNFMTVKDYDINDYMKFFKSSGVLIGKNTDQYVKILKNRNDSMSYDK